MLNLRAGEAAAMTVGTWAALPLQDASHLSQTLITLENSAPVALIATFDMATCDIDDEVAAVLENPELKDFDYIPVANAGSVVGILARHELQIYEGRVQQHLQPLHESILIAADTSLLSFVAEVDQHPVCLVLEGRKITGIVTISDIQKLATRPLLFMLITSVELLLAEWIRQNFDEDDKWIDELSDGRRRKIHEKWESLTQKNMAVDRVTTTDFCDKRSIYLKSADFASGTKKATKRKLDAIEKLRNAVAHAGDYALTPEAACEVAKTVQGAKEIITTLQEELGLSPCASS